MRWEIDYSWGKGMNEDCGAMSEKVCQEIEKVPCGDPQGTVAGFDGGDDEHSVGPEENYREVTYNFLSTHENTVS